MSFKGSYREPTLIYLLQYGLYQLSGQTIQGKQPPQSLIGEGERKHKVCVWHSGQCECKLWTIHRR